MNKLKLDCQLQLDFLKSFTTSFDKYISSLDSPNPIDDDILSLLLITQKNQNSHLLSHSESIKLKIFQDIFIHGYDPELTLKLYRCSIREYTQIIKDFLLDVEIDF